MSGKLFQSSHENVASSFLETKNTRYYFVILVTLHTYVLDAVKVFFFRFELSLEGHFSQWVFSGLKGALVPWMMGQGSWHE